MSKTTPCKAIGLVCEFLTNPLGLETKTPRLSWKLEDSRLDAKQRAYRIVAASSAEKLDAEKFDLWDTGEVASNNTLDIVYAGKALRSRSAVFWRVQVWDKDNIASDWSDTASFEIGLFGRKDLSAQWIGPKKLRDKPGLPIPMLRKAFTLDAEPVKARLHASACGVMELHLNGQVASPDQLAPGWTDYRKRIELVTYDVTTLLQKGDNVVGAFLGEGWFAGNLVWAGKRCNYGAQTAFFAQLEVTLADGSMVTIVTDKTWKLTEEGPILSSDYYMGETYDANREIPGWDAPGFDDSAWKPVAVFPDLTVGAPAKSEVLPSKGKKKAAAPKGFKINFHARPNNGIQRQLTIDPIARTEPTPGVYLFDLGQNMVGHAYLELYGKKGGTITIRYAEMLNPDGTAYVANLRTAKSIDTYICKGMDDDGCPEIYEPHFTFHGFRYIELSGDFEKIPECDDISGVVLHTTMEQTGGFECSDELANKLYSNLNWGHVGNYLDVPTDCPQRDERLGWTGDAQVFVRTAAFNRDVAAFFTKWAHDLEDSQFPNGSFTDVAPDVLGGNGHCAWGDAGVICPWTMYLMYGDTQILADHYDAMAKWLDYWQSVCTKDGVVRYRDIWHYGDWLSVDCPVDENGNPNCGAAPTPSDLISTAYYARCAAILADTAKILGKKDDAKKFAALRKKLVAAYRREFITAGGRVAGDTQTGYLLTLGFDLVDDPVIIQRMVDRLAFLIESRGNTLTTGFVGTPLLCPVLTRYGRSDLAYKLFHQTVYPSWNFTILQGATTMWERWNSYSKKHGFGDVGMNSFNHYAYGAIGEWMYSTVGGIDFAEPGFRKIRFAPIPGGNVTWAKSSFMTRHGEAAIDWKVINDKGGLCLHLVVPPNTTAVLELPGKEPVEFPAGSFDVKTK